MKLQDFNPHVRFCSDVWLYSEYERNARAYDFRLFYLLSGGFTAHFEDKTVTVNEGGVLLFPPGRAYRLVPDEYKKSNHIIVNFDFVSDKAEVPPLTVFEPDPFLAERICSTAFIEPFSDIFHMENAFFCREVLQKMCEEIKADRLHANEMLSGMMKQLLLLISREASRKPHATKRAGTSLRAGNGLPEGCGLGRNRQQCNRKRIRLPPLLPQCGIQENNRGNDSHARCQTPP